MPDKSGWRKKRPKDLKLGEDAAPADDPRDRPRRQSDRFRKTIHGGRPATPMTASTPATRQIDVGERQVEAQSEVSTPHKVKPKLSQYLSNYRSFKEASKGPEFAEPWSDDAPLPFEPLIDPLVALQAVYSHMRVIPTRPIPIEHNSGLFRLFEDYRQVRDDKERLDVMLQEVLEDWKQAEDSWVDDESNYQAEIRRLELLIAHGTSGMAGLMRARQGSVIKRKPALRKTLSTDRLPGACENMPQGQLDEQIKLRSQKVLLHCASSPSGKMAILSRQFASTGSAEDIPVGTPPSLDRAFTLSRKVKSDLNLANLGEMSSANMISASVDSGFSANGDPLPDEMGYRAVPTGPVIECDAFVALQELGALVARRNGVHAEKFLSGLMQLFSTAELRQGDITGHASIEESDKNFTFEQADDEAIGLNLTPNRRLRHFRSQPQLGSEQKRKRHFSFEPGDDQLGALEEDLRSYEQNRPPLPIDSSDSESSQSSIVRSLSQDTQSRLSASQLQSLHADMKRSSKIPSPVQQPGFGSVRRESSASSLQSAFGRPFREGRRDSRTSVLTAFRENSSGSLRPVSKSKSSFNLGQDVGLQQGQAGSSRRPSSIVTTSATSPSPPMSSLEKAHKHQPSGGSLARTIRPSSADRSENDSPHRRS